VRSTSTSWIDREGDSEMASEPPAGLLEVGRCGKPHGVRGRTSVRLSSDRFERLAPGSRLWVGEWLEVVSSSPVPGSDRWIVGFAGFDDRTDAERLVNRTIWGEPLEDDEAVWVHQVIGAEVRDARGFARGRCLSVIANPANDLLELDSGALIPVNFVTSVTSEDGVMFTVVVDPPEGLFELYESASDGPR
jgi:16S rRNA processing protein RimM